MGDVVDYARPDRPSTAQPPPEHVPGAASVHDLVIEDAETRYAELVELLRERKAFGLRKYDTILQVEDPKRDPIMDLIEELGDAVVYAYRAKAHGKAGAAEAYQQLLHLAGKLARAHYPRDAAR